MNRRGQYKIVTAAMGQPVSVADVKSHLKIDYTDDDTLLGSYIGAAVDFVEQYCARALMVQTIQIAYDCFPGTDRRNPLQALRLHQSPVRSVEELKYYDADNAEQTLTEGTDFVLDKITAPARITPAPGKSWPSTAARVGAVLVSVECGYTAATDVPAAIRQAILLLVGDMYEVRQDYPKKMPTAAERLLAPYVVNEL